MTSVETVIVKGAPLGVRADRDARLLPDGACQIAENLVLEYGDLRVRPGRVTHGTLPSPCTVGIRAMAEFHVTGQSPACRLVCVVGAALYWTTDSSQATLAKVTGVGVSDVHATNPVRFQQFGNRLYIVDGSSAVKYLTMDGTLTSITDVTAPTVAPVLTTNAEPSDVSVLHAWGTDAFYYIKRSPAASSSMNTAYLTPVTPASWARSGGATVHSVSTRAWTSGAYLYGDNTQIAGLEVIADAIDNTKYVDSVFKAYWSLAEPTRYADVIAIRGRFRVKAQGGRTIVGIGYSPGGKVKPSLQFSSETVANDDDANWTTFALGDIPSTKFGDWVELPIEVNSAQMAELTAVKHLRLAYDVQAVSGSRTDEANGYTPAKTYAVTLICDAIIMTVTNPNLPGGSYEVTYTFGYTVGGESRSYNAGGETPYPAVSIEADAAWTIGVALTGIPGTVNAVHVYARTPYTDNKFREITPAGGYTMPAATTTYSLVFDGLIDDDAAYLEEYIGKVPSGCSLLFAHNSRMYYVGAPTTAILSPGESSQTAHDTLYVSNLNDPERVPLTPSTLASIPVDYGGAIRVGVLGEAITAAGVLGSYVLLFKADATYLYTGEPGSADFATVPMSNKVGCGRQETVVNAGNKALFWLHGDRVHSWAGTAIDEVGEGITPLLTAAGTTRLASAFAVFDPLTQRVILTVPAATSTSTPAATSYVFALRGLEDGTPVPWYTWTNQPDGCALFSRKAATPAVYAGDLYGATNTGRLYRVSTTTYTDSNSTATAASIAWRMVSKAFVAPSPLHYKQVLRILARVLTPSSGTSQVITLGFYPNGSTARLSSASCTIAQLLADLNGLYEGRTMLIPAGVPQVEYVQLLVSGTASAEFRVMQLEAQLAQRGEIR